ncbi:MAG: SO_0444 family Cu/Zn efflux transporter [Desulfobacteraceae bacterium]|nr:SO_0444 family Cu/Zn efflux transporter [Desulfobacteraceae bacterium]
MNLAEDILREFIYFLMEASPYMLLGFFVAGLLKAFLPDDFVKKHIGSGKKSGILKASAFGIPIPLCSCGVVPAAAGIRKQGGGKGSVVSFLVSTPETGVDSIAITYAMLGPVMAVIRPVAAFFSALFTGFLVHFFDDKKGSAPGELTIHSSCGCSSGCCSSTAYEKNHIPVLGNCSDSNHLKNELKSDSLFMKFKRGMKFAFVDLISDISAWFLIGVFFAALIAVFITPEMVEAVTGQSFLFVMVIMLAVSVPLYVCASSSTPVAAAFLMTGVSPGAALIFLLAGPATNAASFSMISKIIGKKSAVIYLFGVIISSVIAGILTDLLYFYTKFQVLANSGEISSEPGFYIKLVSTVILSVLFAFPLFLWVMKKSGLASKKSEHQHNH